MLWWHVRKWQFEVGLLSQNSKSQVHKTTTAGTQAASCERPGTMTWSPASSLRACRIHPSSGASSKFWGQGEPPDGLCLFAVLVARATEGRTTWASSSPPFSRSVGGKDRYVPASLHNSRWSSSMYVLQLIRSGGAPKERDQPRWSAKKKGNEAVQRGQAGPEGVPG
jgi:hypothetical protein